MYSIKVRYIIFDDKNFGKKNIHEYIEVVTRHYIDQFSLSIVLTLYRPMSIYYNTIKKKKKFKNCFFYNLLFYFVKKN